MVWAEAHEYSMVAHELGRQRSACIGVGAHVSGRQMPVCIGGGDP